MPKRKNNIYFMNCTYSNLYEAYTICKKGKTNRLDVILFSMDIEKNLKEILCDILRNAKVGDFVYVIAYAKSSIKQVGIYIQDIYL